MTEPVRPLEALIAEWRQNAIDADRARDSGDNIDWDAGEAIRRCADELSALLQAAAPPAPTTEWRVPRGEQISEGGRPVETVVGIWDYQRVLTDDERGALRAYITQTGGGILADSYERPAAPPERVSEGKEP